MKYVINSQYGGFSLSDKAIHHYAKLKGITLYEKTDGAYAKYFKAYYTEPDFRMGSYFSGLDIPRNDLALIQTVEELGKAANGNCATLKIVDIPSGERYRLQEYDGNEWIELASEIEWSIAT